MYNNLNSIIIEGKVIDEDFQKIENKTTFRIVSKREDRQYSDDVVLPVIAINNLSKIVNGKEQSLRSDKEIRVVGRLCVGDSNYFFILAEHIEFKRW